jgi:hypothetical protein
LCFLQIGDYDYDLGCEQEQEMSQKCGLYETRASG